MICFVRALVQAPLFTSPYRHSRCQLYPRNMSCHTMHFRHCLLLRSNNSRNTQLKEHATRRNWSNKTTRYPRSSFNLAIQLISRRYRCATNQHARHGTPAVVSEARGVSGGHEAKAEGDGLSVVKGQGPRCSFGGPTAEKGDWMDTGGTASPEMLSQYSCCSSG